MSKNYKVNANSSLLEFKRKHNLFVENVEDFENKQEIIKNITREYIEDSDITYINFPKGVGLLSITLNTHTLYLYDGVLVDNQGRTVEGYELDGYEYENDYVYIGIYGNHIDDVINSISYYHFDNPNINGLLMDTYHLYYPIKREGSTLYKHKLNGMGINLLGGVDEIISKDNTKITDFNTLKQVFDKRISSGFVNTTTNMENIIPIGLFDNSIVDGNYYGNFITQSGKTVGSFSSSTIPYQFFEINDTVTIL